jgi:hypothetical protein
MRIEAFATAGKQYRSLVMSWKGSGPEPPQLAEARTFLMDPACQTPR